jgi:hypothetical protein
VVAVEVLLHKLRNLVALVEAEEDLVFQEDLVLQVKVIMEALQMEVVTIEAVEAEVQAQLELVVLAPVLAVQEVRLLLQELQLLMQVEAEVDHIMVVADQVVQVVVVMVTILAHR